MGQRLFPEVAEILGKFVPGVKGILKEDFVGAYLQGSFAVGDFDADSDVDFAVVVRQELDAWQVRELQALHGHVFDMDNEWAKHLEGSYFPLAVLRDYQRSRQDLWYLDNGSRTLIRSTHCNTAAVRWIIRERGLTLDGPKPETLVDEVPVSQLREEMIKVMGDWWEEIKLQPDEIGSHFYQSFAVLQYCRMWHNLHTGTIGSKRAGAAWAKQHLSEERCALIDRAWAGRTNPAVSVKRPADKNDLRLTLDLLAHIMTNLPERTPAENW